MAPVLVFDAGTCVGRRLLYEFAPQLAGLVPELLPAVLMLLRSKAREVIKSVLGFVKASWATAGRSSSGGGGDLQPSAA